MASQSLEDRRVRVLPPDAPHFFDEILHIVKGEGMWLWDAGGREYLYFYNNVASVGHCHPDVVAALAEQAGKLNISTRYLHEAIVEFAEALTAKLPDHLDTCYFACTGTEANDLAAPDHAHRARVADHRNLRHSWQRHQDTPAAYCRARTCRYRRGGARPGADAVRGGSALSRRAQKRAAGRRKQMTQRQGRAA